MNNFFRRTLTGAGIVFFVLGGFWLHPVSFFLTGLVLLVGTQYEYYRMVGYFGVRPQKYFGIFTGVMAYAVSTLISLGLIPGNSLLVLIFMVFLLMVTELYRKQERPFDSLAHTIFGLLYTVVPFSLFSFSAFSRSGLDSLLPHNGIIFSPGIVVGFFLLIWTNDTGAYLTGISIGRHRMFERISPKKTWEGFFGGLLIAACVAWLLSGWLGVVKPVHWIIISLIISVTGTCGDLIESMLKRSAGVKDSGSIMPGHGGFLDRFDSTLSSFPIVYLFISLFG